MNSIKHHIGAVYSLALVVMMSFTLAWGTASAQSTKIRAHGQVLDQKGEPLTGATIAVDGTTTGTITGVSGDFSLEVAPNSTLVVSFVSYITQRISVTATTPMPLTVTLKEDVVTLNETVVVAVGYGTMRKSDLTGAIASVSSDDLRKGVITSTEQVLQGRVAGLSVVQGSGDPAAGSTLRLRGGTSLTAGNSPLIVVDGIPGVDINTVQPGEIVSIDVLKDASSAAIYGSRGANGVIIITTKREGKQKAIEYSGYAAVGQVNRRLDLLSGNQWRRYVRDNNIKGAVDYGASTDWQDELNQTSLSQSHTLSFNSGDKQSGYRGSVTYFKNEGIVKTTSLERLNASLSAYQYGLNDKLKFELGLNANRDTWKPLDYRIFQRAYNLSPTIPVYDANGNFTEVGGTNYENPVEILTNRTTRNFRNRLLGYAKAELELLPGLKSVTNISYEFNSLKENEYKPTDAVLEGQTDKGYARKALGEYSNYQLETYLNYDKTIGKHRVNAMAGYSFLENVYDGFGAMRRGFDSDLFIYNNLGAGQDYRLGDVYSYKGSARLVSFFGRANYSYAGKYLVTATLRRDGSSRFGANNKWGLFPSASAAWRISDETFMKNTSHWLNNLKLRAGYGVTGNQEGIGEYRSLSILGVGSDSYYDAVSDSWKQAYSPTQNPNPDLKWESTAQINIGVDFSLFDRLNGTLEVYQKKTSDLLYTYEVPQPPFLVGTMLANVGDLSNRGIELTLNATLLEKGDFAWSANLTMAHNKQKIDKLSNQAYQTDVIYSGSLHGLPGMSNQFAQVIREGLPVGTFWGYECLGLDENGKFVLADQKTNLGNVQPKLHLGFGMQVNYKAFDASFSAYGMFGQKVLNATNMALFDPNRLPAQNVPDDFLTSGITSDPTYSGYWVEDASFVRLQSVTLGYALPVQKLGLRKARIYVSGENLFVITGYTGTDPEVSTDGLSSPGIDRFNYYPKPTTVSFGVNLTF